MAAPSEENKCVNFCRFLSRKCTYLGLLFVMLCLIRGIDTSFTISDIERASLRSCVILIEENGTDNFLADEKKKNVWKTDRENQLRDLFNNLRDSFSRSDSAKSTIQFGTHKNGLIKLGDKSMKWTNNLPLEINESESELLNKDFRNSKDYSEEEHHHHSPLIIGFRKRKKERSCLIKPDNYEAEMSDGFAYSGSLSQNNLTNFINYICDTYFDSSGQLSTLGQLRERIRKNLHRLKMKSGYSTMEDFYRFDKSNPFISGLHTNQARESLNKNTDLKLAQCEKIDLPNWDHFFTNYFVKSKPVIFKNVSNNWPAFKKWTTDYLKMKFTNNNIHVKLAPNGTFEGCENISQWENHDKFYIPDSVKSQLKFPDLVVVRPAPGTMKFGEFVDFIESSPDKKKNVSAYIEYASIEEYMPGLTSDIREMAFLAGKLKPGHLHHKNVWLSDGNTLGKLHFDAFENFLCQLSGTKQLTMFEPHDNARLYEAHIQEAELSFSKSRMTFSRRNLKDSTSMVMSPVDVLNPDFERFPLFKGAVPINCTISPGEVLYMPSYWWHEVQSTPDPAQRRNLAVNFWYDPFLVKDFPCPECPLDINPKYDYLLENYLKEGQ